MTLDIKSSKVKVRVAANEPITVTCEASNLSLEAWDAFCHLVNAARRLVSLVYDGMDVDEVIKRLQGAPWRYEAENAD